MTQSSKFILPAATKDTPNWDSLPLDAVWLESAEEIVRQCELWTQSGEPLGHSKLWNHLQIAGDDFVVSPLSMRVGALGAANGCLFAHHELRTSLAMPRALQPEVSGERDSWESQWENGILTDSRYFSFRTDGRLQIYNPNHRRQWRPHEVMHGISKFYWNPTMTRFEAYLGARLNELLPIVHWYGWDEILRPVCSAHRGQRLYRHFCADCERAAKPYWELTNQEQSELREAALGHAAFGMDHWQTEWSACLRELSTGIRQSIPRGLLDASSDALGYLKGHWNRITAWSMGAWVERFLIPGFDYYDSLEDYASSVRNLHGQLFFSELQVDFENASHLQQRRVIQELAYRIHVGLENLTEGSDSANAAESLFEPAFIAMERFCKSLEPIGDFGELESQIAAAIEQSSSFLSPTITQTLQGLGIRGRQNERSLQVQLIREGLESTFTHFEEVDAYCEEPLDSFVESEAFIGWGNLSLRYLRWVDEAGIELPGDYQMELQFEAALLRAVGRDEEAESFGTVPGEEVDFAGGRLRLNSTAARLTTTPLVAQKVLGFEEAELAQGTWGELMHVGVATFLGNVRALPLTKAAWECWGALDRGENMSDSPELRLLLSRAIAVWLPNPR